MAKAKARDIEDDAEDFIETAPQINEAAKVFRESPKQLAAFDIQPAGVRWSHWDVMAHADHTIEDVLNPRYLFNKHESYQVGDEFTIKHPFGYFKVGLDLVRVDVAARGIVAHISYINDYTKADTMVAPDLSGCHIEFLGDRGWSIVNDTHVVKDAFATRTQAESWLSDQRRGLA